jgi:hypothetical protein
LSEVKPLKKKNGENWLTQIKNHLDILQGDANVVNHQSFGMMYQLMVVRIVVGVLLML